MLKLLKKILITLIVVGFVSTLILYYIGGGIGNNESPNLISSKEILIFAHRGVTDSIVENSIESFEASQIIGFDAIETDINFTKDKQLIIFHDFTAKRLLGIDKKVSESSLLEMQNKFLHFGNQITKNKVILLKDFIKSYKNNNIFYLDIKDVNISVADSLILYINNYGIKKSALIADTNLLFLAYLKLFEPDVITVLEDYKTKNIWYFELIPKKFKPDYCAGRLTDIDKKYIKFLKENNYFDNMIVYGVNSNNLLDLLKKGFHNVIIDYDQSFGSYQNLKHILSTNIHK